MFGIFGNYKKIEAYDGSVSREVLVQSARLLFVDDEDIPLIDQLRSAGFAVDHDRTGSEFERQMSAQTYDVAILDYTGVGAGFGKDQGLDVLKYINRVSPRTRIIAYTSRAISSNESDFFRLADRVLQKDAGKRESLECVEEQIQRAYAKSHLFEAMMKKLEVDSGGDRDKLLKEVERALVKKDDSKLRSVMKSMVGVAAEKSVDILLNKLMMD
ncbi:response regulator [Stenotrophomonas maltophilia]|uniref:response regulator n=1 Tax=Stenotrophomonas maltophilia TaxID=40324 RepID=UPI00112FE373|nr:response regulator [Stenotrophomonas maltophilia]QGL66137.1 response regulator [Stenotrophomonas maltophilia]